MKCEGCGLSFSEDEISIEHHTNYFPQSTVLMHRSCHTSLHFGHKYQSLLPPKGDAKIFYGKSPKFARIDVLRGLWKLIRKDGYNNKSDYVVTAILEKLRRDGVKV